MEKGVNEKGQEFSITTLLLLVLGIIVLVVIILGFTLGWNFIFGKIGLLPGQSLQTVVSSCKLAANNGLTADYCSTFKADVDINGVKQDVTCDYLKEKSLLSPETKDVVCSNSDSVSLSYCGSGAVKTADFAKKLVNGRTCASVLGITLDSSGKTVTVCGDIKPTGYQGTPKDSCEANELEITGLLKTPPEGRSCCLVPNASK